MVTGTLAAFNHSTHTLVGHMLQKLDKKKVEILEVENVANVLEEKVGHVDIWNCIQPGTILNYRSM